MEDVTKETQRPEGGKKSAPKGRVASEVREIRGTSLSKEQAVALTEAIALSQDIAGTSSMPLDAMFYWQELNKALQLKSQDYLHNLQKVDYSHALAAYQAIIENLKLSRGPHAIPAALAAAPAKQEYVDPYLFETGHFESREEYEELSRTAKIKPRARS